MAGITHSYNGRSIACSSKGLNVWANRWGLPPRPSWINRNRSAGATHGYTQQAQAMQPVKRNQMRCIMKSLLGFIRSHLVSLKFKDSLVKQQPTNWNYQNFKYMPFRVADGPFSVDIIFHTWTKMYSYILSGLSQLNMYINTHTFGFT